MAWFGKRESTFEDKFAHDEELKFKILARRTKLVGVWAARQLGLRDDEADTYVEEIIKFGLAEPGDEPLFRKLRADFDAKGVKISDHKIRRRIDETLREATTQIKGGK